MIAFLSGCSETSGPGTAAIASLQIQSGDGQEALAGASVSQPILIVPVDASGEAAPSCHVTTGMLAAFFGRLAGYPVSVMETECCSAGAERCRFMLGNSDVMAFKWEELR